MQIFRLSALTLALLAVSPAPSFAATSATASTAQANAAVAQYATLVHAGYEDSLAGALDLQKAIAAFVAAPDAAKLDAARNAWRAAREFYGQTEAFRFYAGPIDNDNGPEGRLNAWPLDESYIDYVAGKPNAGIVNNPKLKIDKATLKRLNEKGGEENIAAGWHAIEFLLWGQDRNVDGPGNRPHTDYIDGQAPNAERRRQYLSIATELLVDDLASLVKAWVPAAKNYRANFEKAGTASLRKMLFGLGSLSRGELAGERLEVAQGTQDQEDEHSCFSDNTHRDVVANAQGIANVWFGRYTRRDGSALQGASLRDLVAATDAPLAERVSAQIDASVTAANAIPAPFDRAIVGNDDAPGRQAIRATINALVAQSKGLVDAASALGIKRLNISAAK